MVDAVLAETRTAQRRIRDLPARVVVYLLLAGCLFAGQGYRQVWQRRPRRRESLRSRHRPRSHRRR
ncbi:transposase domain-containing protein [Dactylosporangium sp. NPDC000244]|uniref:transposase domain-containing protein n=1 Tax=Dactylosporangium sp. NPDC000244 TaxID=3154365 RepID=UPI00331FDC63